MNNVEGVGGHIDFAGLAVAWGDDELL